MDLLAGADGNVGNDGRRFVVSPRKGTKFLGPKERQRNRIRERRRKVFVVLAEATFFTLLIGLAPPFRPMLMVGVLLAGALGGYCWLLVRMKQMEDGTAHTRERAPARSGRTAEASAQGGYAQGRRYVAEGRSSVARPSYAGLATMSEGDDSIHVIVQEN